MISLLKKQILFQFPCIAFIAPPSNQRNQREVSHSSTSLLSSWQYPSTLPPKTWPAAHPEQKTAYFPRGKDTFPVEQFPAYILTSTFH